MNESTEWIANSDHEPPARREVIDWWGLWTRRKGLILFGVALGLALGTLYYFQATPIYESKAELYIVDRNPPTVPVEGIDGGSRYNSSKEGSGSPHELIIASPLVVGRAVEESKLMQLPSFRDTGYTQRQLVDRWLGKELLTVYPIDGKSNVVEMSFRGPSREDSAKVLQAVIASYENFLGDTHQSVGRETAELISAAKDDLLRQLNEKEAEYSEFRQESPLLWKDGEGTNLHLERQNQIEMARTEVLLRRSELAARVESIEAALDRGDNAQSLLLMISQSTEKPLRELQGGVESPLHHSLLELLIKQRELLEKFGADHPKVKSIDKQVQMASTYVRRVETQSAGGRDVVTDPAKFLVEYLQSLRDEIKSINQQVTELDTLFAEEQLNAKELTAFLVRDATFRSDLQRTQQLFEATVKRLEEINIVKDYGAYTLRILSPPELGSQVAPNLIITFGVALILGVTGGLGLAYVVDLADQSFHSPAEICQYLRLPLVGHVPIIPSARRAASTALGRIGEAVCAYHDPKSQLAEAYRAVRTSLYFNTRRDQHQVIQITSPTPGDGKSTLAANLAVAIAQSGKRVLLLDADFRRPTVHKLFGLSMQTGLAQVVAGQLDPQEAYQTTDIHNLTLMSCGPRPHNPSELLTSPRFAELVAVLREQFDFVLIDTPPLLAVTDPCAVAARADGVLLALRLKKNVRPDAIRSAELLSEVGAEVLGVVVNAVSDKQSGYSYGYRKYDSEIGGYFAEAEAEAAVATNGAAKSRLQDAQR